MREWTAGHRRPSFWLTTLLMAALIGGGGAGPTALAAASSDHAKSRSGASARPDAMVKTKVNAKAKARAEAKAQAQAKKDKEREREKEKERAARAEARAGALAIAKSKVAILAVALDGDAGETSGGERLRARVVRLLRAKGLKVTTTLRPVDSAEQYREMADTLGLAAFLDGETSEDGDQASITIHVRSGVSGLRVASATLSGDRRKLAAEIDRSLWTQLQPPLARICVEAAKPRKREREPMRIEAGTPLTGG